MASAGFIVSLKSGGYMEPGVETKLSAKLSAGECSNLMLGVFDMMGAILSSVGLRALDGAYCGTMRFALNRCMQSTRP
jgi:hypothetical protein